MAISRRRMMSAVLVGEIVLVGGVWWFGAI